MSTIGVAVFSLPGMKRLAQCVESVKWADRVVVFHMVDDELDRGPASSSGPLVRRWSVGDEERAESPALSTDWVLHLWGDERVDEGLQRELQLLREKNPTHLHAGYGIPIRSYILGRWAEGSMWEPAPALRLRRRLENIAGGWPSASVSAPSDILSGGWIEDYGASRLSDGWERLRKVSDVWCEEMQRDSERNRSFSPVRTPAAVFFRLWWSNGPIRGGFSGLTFSTLAAYAVFLSGAKLWEMGCKKSDGRGAGQGVGE